MKYVNARRHLSDNRKVPRSSRADAIKLLVIFIRQVDITLKLTRNMSVTNVTCALVYVHIFHTRRVATVLFALCFPIEKLVA